MLRALPFEIENPQAMDQGTHYYVIGLTGGRRVSVWGDRIEITPAGVLIIWQETTAGKLDDVGWPIDRQPGKATINLALAPKTWADVYPASAGNSGLPLAVDTVTA